MMGITSAINPLDIVQMIQAAKYIKNAKKYVSLKKQLQKADTNPETEIIGITGFKFMERTIKASDLSTPVINGLTDTIDSSTYPDRAIITLKNELGYNAYITNFVIDGQPIIRYKGALSHDSLRRDDDILRNGESTFELGNEYIIDATQVDRLADYWFKYLGKKKHVYSVSIRGFAPWYSPGDWYTLSVGSAGTNEYISSTVECYDVQCSRTAGDIGSTTLMLREVEENWTKTTLYAARAVTGGSPKRRSQQSNRMFVVASTFDGTYDYKCDGTADDVEIQAAIDYVYYTWGGGTVFLMGDEFLVTTKITLRSNIILCGDGKSTIKSASNTLDSILYNAGSGTNMVIRDLIVDGNSTLTYTANMQLITTSTASILVENVTAKNCLVSVDQDVGNFVAIGISVNGRVINCTVDNLESINVGAGGAYVVGFSGPNQIVNCNVDNLDATGTTWSFCIGYDTCWNVTTCSSGTLTAAVGSGTTGGQGFNSCTLVTNCISTNAAANSIGYAYCKSMLGNRSVSNATHYYASYADSGTANACADTAAGGYNS